MTQRPEIQSFGEMLRYFRGQTIEKGIGRPLSQERLAYHLSLKSGITITRNKENNWENGKTSPRPQLDRGLLTDMIAVLQKFRGIKTLDEANQLLEAGNYQPLTTEEVNQIHPEWNPSVIPQYVDGDTSAQMVPGIGSGAIDVRFVEPLKVHFQRVRSALGIVPPVPSLFIGRDDDLKRLKQNLGLTGKSGVSLQILTAIKGWPGVGKTTMASALAYDPDVEKSYPDGILWVSLGQKPNVLSEMAAWGRALGTNDLLRAKTVEESRIQLAALLHNRKMLLIIDDVWDYRDAVPFNVGGQNCATLITTRRDDVAIALAPSADNIYRLKVLSDEDALTLLKQLAPSVVEMHPNESIVLVKELEGLPLALQVAGRLLNAELNRGFGVIELIEDLRLGTRLLEAQPPADRLELANETTPTIASLLQKSLDLLDETTRGCYAYLGVFAPKPATFDVNAMKSVWQLDDPKPVIEILVDRGLLEFVPELGRYQMHALLVMLAKSLLTDDEGS